MSSVGDDVMIPRVKHVLTPILYWLLCFKSKGKVSTPLIPDPHFTGRVQVSLLPMDPESVPDT